MKTLRLTNEYEVAADILRSGGLVAVPTETVYGLAGNGLDPDAVQKIYDVKGRPAVKPLSLMVPGAQAMETCCVEIPPAAFALAERFWPGPLTIVLKAKESIPEIVRAGGKTVGLRCPNHEATLQILQNAGIPFAAPSANPSGSESPKTAEEVLRYFDGRIDAVVDGGPCGFGKESTIVDLSSFPFRILRQGALPENEVWNALADEMCVIGITGGTGCGKTTALNVLAEMGALVLDGDEIYHELLRSDEELLREISLRFPGVVTDGMLDRKLLGNIVFRDPDALADLNAITHPFVLRVIDDRLRDWARQGGSLAAIDAIALIESGVGKRCDQIIGITAPRSERIRRIMTREGIPEEYAAARVDAQKPDAWFAEHCDCIIDNRGTLEEFETLCRKDIEEVVNHE